MLRAIHIFDLAVIGATLVLPFLFVLRFSLPKALLGAFALWVFLAAESYVIAELDPEKYPWPDEVLLKYGLPALLAYTLAIWGLKKLIGVLAGKRAMR